jgi:PPM family protein phosphatase
MGIAAAFDFYATGEGICRIMAKIVPSARITAFRRITMDDPTEDTDPGTGFLNTAAGPQVCLASMVQAEFGAISHVGCVRTNNEDHYLVARLGRSLEPLMTNVPLSGLPAQLAEYGYGMLVADGMGGAAAGEVASRMAITLLVNLIIDTAKWGRRIDEAEAEALMERLWGYYSRIHSTLTRQAESEPDLAGMGTTLTVAYSFCSDLFIAHVGDSRAYLFRHGRLHRLTHDHTVAQKMVDQGLLPPQELEGHRYRHILTNVLGGRSSHVDTDIQHFRLGDRDRLLLCSDGLTDMLEDCSIAEILQRVEAPGDASAELVDRALCKGGKDNVTVIVAKYSFAGAAET